MPDKKYEETGNNYRFFLGWRHAAFAGNLIIIYGAMSLTLSTYKDSASLAWLIPGLASPVGILLWMIDVRTRDLYHAAIEAGKKLEGNDGGFYTQLADKVKVPVGTSPFNKNTQSGALNILFLGFFSYLNTHVGHTFHKD
jgi:hypothetical protein